MGGKQNLHFSRVIEEAPGKPFSAGHMGSWTYRLLAVGFHEPLFARLDAAFLNVAGNAAQVPAVLLVQKPHRLGDGKSASMRFHHQVARLGQQSSRKFST